MSLLSWMYTKPLSNSSGVESIRLYGKGVFLPTWREKNSCHRGRKIFTRKVRLRIGSVPHSRLAKAGAKNRHLKVTSLKSHPNTYIYLTFSLMLRHVTLLSDLANSSKRKLSMQEKVSSSLSSSHALSFHPAQLGLLISRWIFHWTFLPHSRLLLRILIDAVLVWEWNTELCSGWLLRVIAWVKRAKLPPWCSL